MTSQSWQLFMAARVVIGALLLNMVLGTTMSWSNFTVYVTSYLRSEHPDVRYEDTAWVTALTGAMVGFSSYLGGILLETIGPRQTSALGGLLLSVAVALSYWTVQQGLLPFLFTYAVLFGLGSGIMYPAPMKCAMQWAPGRRGLITGFVMCGAGFGPVVAIALQTSLVNPGNIRPSGATGSADVYFTDESLLRRVPPSFTALGCCFGVCSLVGALLLAQPTEQNSGNSHGVPVDEETMETKPIFASRNLTPDEMVRTREFWLMWFCYFLNMICVNFVVSFVKVIGQNSRIMSDHELTVVASVAVLFNGIGRLGWGYFGDVVSFRAAMQTMSFAMAALTAILITSARVGFAMYFVVSCCIFICVGGVSSIWPGAVSLYFGDEHFGRNFGLIVTAGGLGWIVGAAGVQLLRTHVSDMSMSFCSAAFNLLACGCGTLLQDRSSLLDAKSEQKECAAATGKQSIVGRDLT